MAAIDGQAVPPNSLEAIRACLDANADIVELDITALADQDYLLVHDPVLESETTGHGDVRTCTASQARQLRFRLNGNATDFRAPMLGEVVELFRLHGGSARLQLDFKDAVPFDSDEPLRRLVRLIEPLGDRVIVSSIADWQLRKLRALAPWLDLGFDIQFYLDWRESSESADGDQFPRQRGAYGYWDDHPIALRKFWPTAEYLSDRCSALIGLVPGASTFYVDHKLLTQSLDDGFNWAEALHAVGIKLDAWTMDVTDPVAMANAPRLLASGVDSFTTNTPRGLAKLLGERIEDHPFFGSRAGDTRSVEEIMDELRGGRYRDL